MPEAMHPLKAIRREVVWILTAADIEINVGSGRKRPSILVNPPSGGAAPQSSLPAIFVYPRSEQRLESSSSTDEQRVLVDVVMQSYGNDDEALDHVDDMQLAVEIAILANPRLSGLAMGIRATGSEIDTVQGEVSFAVRRVTFEVRREMPRNDPTVTY